MESLSYLMGAEKGFQIASSHIGVRLLVDCLGSVQQTNRNVSAQKGQPLKQEATRARHALLIRPPVIQAIVAELVDDLETLLR